MNSPTRSRPDHEIERDEESLRTMLAQARVTAAENALQAERQYAEALQFARDAFGEKSSHLATALFHMSAFYAASDKLLSARAYMEQLMLFLRS